MIKRSVTIRRHRTSVSLEEPFWRALGEIAALRGTSVASVIGEIDDARSRGMARRAGGGGVGGLSSAIRLAVLDAARSGLLARAGESPAPGAAAGGGDDHA